MHIQKPNEEKTKLQEYFEVTKTNPIEKDF